MHTLPQKGGLRTCHREQGPTHRCHGAWSGSPRSHPPKNPQASRCPHCRAGSTEAWGLSLWLSVTRTTPHEQTGLVGPAQGAPHRTESPTRQPRTQPARAHVTARRLAPESLVVKPRCGRCP